MSFFHFLAVPFKPEKNSTKIVSVQKTLYNCFDNYIFLLLIKLGDINSSD